MYIKDVASERYAARGCRRVKYAYKSVTQESRILGNVLAIRLSFLTILNNLEIVSITYMYVAHLQIYESWAFKR